MARGVLCASRDDILSPHDGLQSCAIAGQGVADTESFGWPSFVTTTLCTSRTVGAVFCPLRCLDTPIACCSSYSFASAASNDSRKGLGVYD